jgi:hypothetical protein
MYDAATLLLYTRSSRHHVHHHKGGDIAAQRRRDKPSSHIQHAHFTLWQGVKFAPLSPHFCEHFAWSKSRNNA